MSRNHALAVLWLPAAVCLAAASSAAAQDKVIQKTTDKGGFEHQLTEVDLMLQTASQLMSAGQWEQAAAELEKVVARDSTRVDGWQDLAKCYTVLKKYEPAANAYLKASDLKPADLDLLSNLGYSQLNAQRLEPAMLTYQKMLAVDAFSYDANVHLGFIHQQNNKLDEAIPFYEKALEGKPDDVQTMGSLARIYADQDKFDQSIAMYDRAVAAAPADMKVQLRSQQGKMLIGKKSYVKAADVYGKLVEADPGNAANQYNLAISLMQSDRPKEAAPHFEAVIGIKPDYALAYQYAASSYSDAGQYQQSINVVKKGLPYATDKAGMYCVWGRSLEKLGLFDEAIDVFQKALGDAQWGDYAKKQIQRQEDLKKRKKMISGQ